MNRAKYQTYDSHAAAGSRRGVAGFTLVELLVVIAIIGILIALLLPAIQAAREAGRRAQCKNNLRQIAIACLNHEAIHKTYPHGGWGFAWMGDPDKGYGPQQPGGWIYAVTPYLEEIDVFNVGGGLAPADKANALKDQLAAGLNVFICPSRRSTTTLTSRNPLGKYTDSDDTGNEVLPYNAGVPDRLAKTDYAIHGGTGRAPATGKGYPPNAPPPLASDCLPGPFPNCVGITNDYAALKNFNGISTKITGAKVSQITDGTSKTAMAGEKSMLPRFYDTGYGETPTYSKNNGGDNNSMYQGYDYDNTRWIGSVPLLDDDNNTNVHFTAYGSAHPGGVNIALADGSVQSFSYDIDDNAWGGYGSREDGDTE